MINMKITKEFYNIKFKYYLITYAVLLVLSASFCALHESDGDAALMIFLLFFGIYFLISEAAAGLTSLITSLIMKKVGAERKKIATVIFTLLSAAYLISLGLSLYSFMTLDLSPRF